MTGAEFNTEVLAFMDTDAARRGLTAFRAAFQRAAIADLAAYIDEFAVGKLTFGDTEQTPFDTDSAEAVAEFIKSKIARNVDRDMNLSQAHWMDYQVLRRRMFVRLKEARTPELRPWIGKPYTVILNLRKGAMPQPITDIVLFTVKEYKGDPDECAIVELERDNGIEVLDPATSKIRVTIPAEDTAKFILGRQYYWDVQVAENGVLLLPLHGELNPVEDIGAMEVTETSPVIPLHGELKVRQPVGTGKPPSFTTQPVGGTITVGDTLSVTVKVHGSGPLSYQWRKNGVAIPGATDATYSYTTTSTGDSGDYDVVVTNRYGSLTSDVAHFDVLSGVSPIITVQPTGGTIMVGGLLTLSITAAGTPPLAYQWRKDGVNIPGATNFSHSKVTTSVSDSGSYDCIVTNAFGSSTSAAAVWTVVAAPAIAVHPVGGNVAIGQTLNVSVTATGTAPLSYQWRKDGVEIPGATSSSYSRVTTSPADSGNYNCIVTNPYGFAASNSALFNVGAAPAITTHPTGGELTIGETLSVTVAATGDAPLSYQWRKNGSDILGATSATYAFTTTHTSDSGTYACLVTNLYGSAASNPAVFIVTGLPLLREDGTPLKREDASNYLREGV